VVLLLHVIAAIAWGIVVQWPWGRFLFHAFIALGAIHLLAPWWFHLSRVTPFHRAFLVGPLALAAIDAGFLFYAWRSDIWSDLTVVFVPVLAGVAALALLYGLLVMSLLDRWRTRRAEKKKAKSTTEPPP
jgi:hypothetical protein